MRPTRGPRPPPRPRAIQLQGEAQAAAIRAQADALKANSNLVELRRAERWDGKLPVNVYELSRRSRSREASVTGALLRVH